MNNNLDLQEEKQLVDELLGAAYQDPIRAAEICEILFDDSTIAAMPELTYIAAIAMRIVLRSGTRRSNFGRLTGWNDGLPKTIRI